MNNTTKMMKIAREIFEAKARAEALTVELKALMESENVKDVIAGTTEDGKILKATYVEGYYQERTDSKAVAAFFEAHGASVPKVETLVSATVRVRPVKG